MYIPRFQPFKTQQQFPSKQQKKNLLNQPEIQNMKNEVNFYTLKKEKDQKKLRQAQNLLKTLQQELKVRKESFQQMQIIDEEKDHKEFQFQNSILKREYNKTIKKSNEISNQNKDLILDINSIRKERVNLLDQIQILQKRLDQSSNVENQLNDKLDYLKNNNTQTQAYIFKNQNEQKENQYIKQLDQLKQELETIKLKDKFQKFQKEKEILTNIDFVQIMSIRLVRIIQSNKDKVKIIDEYMKRMQSIDEQFEKIKQYTGIQDLDEIANTFIKSDSQNYQLYEYIDQLNKDIDQITDQNEEQENQIAKNKIELECKQKNFESLGQIKIQEDQILEQIAKKENKVTKFQEILKQISPTIKNFLILLSVQSFSKRQEALSFLQNDDDFLLNENNMEQYLGEIELLLEQFFEIRKINNKFQYKKEKEIKLEKKFNPSILDEASPLLQQSNLMYDKLKFQNFAQEIINKKSQNKIKIKNQ